MIRITDQYVWNALFTLLFLLLIVMAAIILDTEAYRPLDAFTPLDLVLVTLASWRLTRLFVYDHIFKFIREQWYDAVATKGGYVLEKPARGPRRTLADLFGCPWCFGVWASALVVFLYALTPWFMYVTVFLAISAVATYLQLLANLTGHKAEQLKHENEHSH